MLRLIHTADWQIGRVFSQFEDDDAEALAAARFAVVERIAALAVAERADAILVAGDVFDAQGVRDKTIHRLFLATAGFPGPWIMIAGNHDAALPASVWTRAQRLGAVPANVRLALAPVPLVLEGKCVILPAPLTQRHTYNDLTEWFAQAETPPELPRVGLAHGSVQGILAEDIDSANPIAPDRAETARLDYLALGDWHGMRAVSPRCWYAGTPEPDRFRDNASGHALCVEIAAPGAVPTVRALSTASYRWRVLEVSLRGPSDVDELLATLGSLGAEDVLQLRCTGSVDLKDHERLQHACQRTAARVRALLSDMTALSLVPTDADLAALHADGYVGETLEWLRAQQQDMDAASAALARAALLELARALRPTGASAQVAP